MEKRVHGDVGASQISEKVSEKSQPGPIGTLFSSLSDKFIGEDTENSFLGKAKLKSKAKVVSAWNNVKYGFNVPYKPSLTEDSPVWFLGKCYDKRKIDYTDYPNSQKEQFKIADVDEFFDDFAALIWLTYRKEFPQLQNSTLTTDCGWGCMLRTGQMILANTLLMHFLKDDWRKTGKLGYSVMDYHYRMILKFFNDEESDFSPFSLHQLVKIGEQNGRKAGDWYGPSTVAHILSSAMRNALHPSLEGVCIYVSQDCTVYKEDVINLATECRSCTNKDCSDKMWRAVLILVPVRLGGEGLNPIYIPCIKTLLTLNHCIGIIGGRPKHSLYFLGFQDNKLLYLDPHYVQPMVDMSKNDFPVDTFRCPYPRKMGIRKMDPSCCIGFYCRKRSDFDEFCKETIDVLSPPMQRAEYPIFIISEGSRPTSSFDVMDGKLSMYSLRSKLGSFTVEGTSRRQSHRETIEQKDRKTHGHKQYRRKHRNRETEMKDRRNRDSDEYFVVD